MHTPSDPAQFIARLREVDWVFIVARREAILNFSFTALGGLESERYTGVPITGTHLRLDGDVFYPAHELVGIRTYLEREGALVDFHKRLLQSLEQYEALVTELEQRDPSTLTQEELVSALETLTKHATESAAFLTPFPAADRLISDSIVARLPEGTPEQRNAWLFSLTFPEKENSHTEEARSMLSLIQNPDAVSVAAHATRFGWMGARMYWWHLAWTPDSIQGRIDAFHTAGKDPIEELAHLDSMRFERAASGRQLLVEFNCENDPELARLIALAKEFAYIRTWRTDVIYRSGFRARHFYEENLRRVGMDPDEAVWMTAAEHLATARTGTVVVTDGELSARHASYDLCVLDGEVFVCAGAEWRKRLRSIAQSHQTLPEDLRGTIAFTGKARGTVRVVLCGDDIPKVQPGDILVAVMTFPDYVPAMEKAAAFVTDEGGILCHAAIVAREMRKPCVIATKLATHALKDGDLVEVDADAGIVSIISRA